MPGASRKGLPKCEELVPKFSKKRSLIKVRECGKPAVAVWYWRSVSDEPKHVCSSHDEKINAEEMKDELERELDEESEI
jgi:hypothetical protein